MRNEIKGLQKSQYIRYVSEQAVICYEAGGHSILKLAIYCGFKHDETGIFKGFVLFGNGG